MIHLGKRNSKAIRSQGWKHIRSWINKLTQSWLWVLKVWSQTTASAAPENLMEMEILKPYWQRTQSKTLGTGPSDLHFWWPFPFLHFWWPFWSFWWSPKSENHCSKPGVNKLQLNGNQVFLMKLNWNTAHPCIRVLHTRPPACYNGRGEQLP